jgi:hypothetical protein
MTNTIKSALFGVAAALLLGVTPAPWSGPGLGVSAAFAGGGHGNSGSGDSGDHGNSGGSDHASSGGSDHASSGGSDHAKPGGNGNAFGHSATAAQTHGKPDHAGVHEASVAALAGSGNAAHASVQGLLHASPHSAVGRVRAYADLKFAARQAQDDYDSALAACNAALDTDCTALKDGDEGTDDPAYLAFTSAEDDLDTATKDANAALLKVTKNADDPKVAAYIDGLLSKYYAYLSGK